MTWDEFKQYVDAQLRERKLDGSIEIWYIDTNFPTEHSLEVECVPVGVGKPQLIIGSL